MIRWLLALIGLPSWLAPVIIVATGAAMLGGAYTKGRLDANANCREAELRSEIEALKRDIAVQKDADAFEDAAARQSDADRARLEQEVADYEKELASRPADARCALTDDDVIRLQPYP